MTSEQRLLGAGGREICSRCTIADTPLPRMRGLLGRSALAVDEGILLRPAPSVHTFFMRFPIDVVFVDRELQVIRVDADVKPWRVTACRGAHAVLELAAGEAARRQIREGELLRFEDAPGVTVAAGWPRVSVILAAADTPFLNIASFLLERAGVDVERARDGASLNELVERRRPDVVVLDASGGGDAAERSLLELSTRHPDIGVVVVAEPAAAALALGALPKWGTFDGLQAAIERALGRASASSPAAPSS